RRHRSTRETGCERTRDYDRPRSWDVKRPLLGCSTDEWPRSRRSESRSGNRVAIEFRLGLPQELGLGRSKVLHPDGLAGRSVRTTLPLPDPVGPGLDLVADLAFGFQPVLLLDRLARRTRGTATPVPDQVRTQLHQAGEFPGGLGGLRPRLVLRKNGLHGPAPDPGAHVPSEAQNPRQPRGREEDRERGG